METIAIFYQGELDWNHKVAKLGQREDFLETV